MEGFQLLVLCVGEESAKVKTRSNLLMVKWKDQASVCTCKQVTSACPFRMELNHVTKKPNSTSRRQNFQRRLVSEIMKVLQNKKIGTSA